MCNFEYSISAIHQSFYISICVWTLPRAAQAVQRAFFMLVSFYYIHSFVTLYDATTIIQTLNQFWVLLDKSQI